MRGLFPEGLPWEVVEAFVETDPPAVAVRTATGSLVRSYA